VSIARATAGLPARSGAALASGAALWAAAYWVNGWLWDLVLYDVLGMEPDARLTETVHFFVYDTVKIVLLLVGSSSSSPCCAPT